MLRRYKNWLKHVFNIRNSILGLRFTTTWRCNSRCVTCSIWQMPEAGKDDLTIAEIDRFSCSKYFKAAKYITFSGGEPTLRPDLPEIFSVLHRNIPGASFNITTHGMDPANEHAIFTKIIKDNPKIQIQNVGLSLNGPAEVHDQSRGIKGCFNKVIETYDLIKGMVPCSFSFTFYNANVKYFEWVQDFAKAKGTKAYICWTVMNERFNSQEKDLIFWQKGMEKVVMRHIERIHTIDRTPKGTFKNILNLPEGICKACLYDNVLNRQTMPCYAGQQIVHILPNGDVFPCNFKMSPDRLLGNLRNQSFDEIWESMPKRILREIAQGKCMYPNGLCGDSDIFPSLSNHPPFVLSWYLRKLIRSEDLISMKGKNQK